MRASSAAAAAAAAAAAVPGGPAAETRGTNSASKLLIFVIFERSLLALIVPVGAPLLRSKISSSAYPSGMAARQLALLVLVSFAQK